MFCFLIEINVFSVMTIKIDLFITDGMYIYFM